MTLRFNLRTFRLDMKERTSPPQCFLANVNVSFIVAEGWGLYFYFTVKLQWLEH